MNTKLTLRLEEKLIRKAKAAARRSGKSVSQLVADYFSLLGRGSSEDDDLAPTVRGLLGVMRGKDVDREDYRRHLEEKYK